MSSEIHSDIEILIEKYRYPDGLNGKKRTYPQVFDEMKKNGVLPITIKSWSSLAKIWERKDKDRLLTNNNYWLQKFLESIINKVTINPRAKFKLFWIDLDEMGKIKFFTTVENMLYFRGVPKDKIHDELVSYFTKEDLLDLGTIDSYITEDYKNNSILDDVRTNENYSFLDELKEFDINTFPELSYVWRLSDDQKRTALINKIARGVLKQGIPISEVSTYLTKVLATKKIIGKHHILKYLIPEFKNNERATRKLGKTKDMETHNES